MSSTGSVSTTSVSSSSSSSPSPSSSLSPLSSRSFDPNLDHLTYIDFEHIYEPSEDSFLFLDALFKDIPQLCQTQYVTFTWTGQTKKQTLTLTQTQTQTQTTVETTAVVPVGVEKEEKEAATKLSTMHLSADTHSSSSSSSLAAVTTAIAAAVSNPTPTPICVEIGGGSGIVITYLSRLIGTSSGYYLATDINPRAVTAIRNTFQQNKVHGDVILCNFVDLIEVELKHKVDVLLFNPPYVPSEPEELLGDGISRSWAGGIKGREVLDKLLPKIKDLLSPTGVFYCVLLSSNIPVEVNALLAQDGFVSEMILHRKAGIEDLQIVRYSRQEKQHLLPKPTTLTTQ